MVNMRNCPNCAAPYETDKNKCPYCGTSYFDMSALNFTDGEPFYLKIKTTIAGKTAFVTQLVKPSLESFETTCDATDIVGGKGNAVYGRCYDNNQLTTNVNFRAIPDQGNTLCTIEMEG